jgi:hypothetical protein
VTRQNLFAHVVYRISRTAIANTHAALIAQASRIHHVDATSSLPQSIDGLNFSNGPPSGAVALEEHHEGIHAQVSPSAVPLRERVSTSVLNNVETTTTTMATAATVRLNVVCEPGDACRAATAS